ncbi:DUF2515 family protein [Bacillus sp. SG-1]|uniref:DUF2515 family protein n=1 Tax=Bacillus sp. SG-1 TaxID=161544 RepID=UPI0018DBE28B|nr:DUF2515 family protein [Bacillus sp. SG-1]
MHKAEIEKIKKLILNKSHTPLAILPNEKLIIEEINSETKRRNTNNITRTKAYLDFYQRYPKIHWSFLAHMVSRNGGYRMTDLKGEILPSLLEAEEIQNFFLFLEKANAFIFQDAYPQLLLYKKSVEKKKPLFHLLPAFGVSNAMSVFWERFWRNGNKEEMTLALIINEQSMLQTRLIAKIKDDYFYEKMLFFLQDRLELTTVFFPYKKKNKSRSPYSLAGTGISYFENPQNRIDIGKKLYCILFMKDLVYDSSFDFALKNPHTASRSDYWPQCYSSKNTGTQKVYSPELMTAWNDMSHTFSNDDWVRDETTQFIDALETISMPYQFDVTTKAKLVVNLSSEYKALST